MKESALFPSAAGPTFEEISGGTTRVFIAGADEVNPQKGLPVLPVPGLVELIGVRVGQLQLPMVLKQSFPRYGREDQTLDVEWPMVILDHDESGMSVLRRNVQSNHGLWQAGERVFVTGVWADGSEEEQDEQAPQLHIVQGGRRRKG